MLPAATPAVACFKKDLRFIGLPIMCVECMAIAAGNARRVSCRNQAEACRHIATLGEKNARSRDDAGRERREASAKACPPSPLECGLGSLARASPRRRLHTAHL